MPNIYIRTGSCHRVVLDVLPAQATGVPCERIFSSSKKTDTLRRSQPHPALMEAL
ncbi:hypothetical protein C8Q70DRAFT_914290 [Cubamyces menziesii]|nr:hypothetical protein C8Q70DRAFT_914290 [Cubamyces menziesii]